MKNTKTEKEQKFDKLKEQIQKQCTKRMSMNEFQKEWNSKNKDKITEMVKLGDVILIRFGNITIHCITENLYL